MDPLRDLCKIQNSFTSKKQTKNIPLYSEVKIGSPRARRKALYENKQQNKIVVDNSRANLPVKIADPFKKINSIFKSRSTHVLADIDTVFNFTLQEDGYINPQVIDQQYNYAVLDTDKGFLQYLQYRLPASPGFTNCVDINNEKQISGQFLNTNCDNGLTDYILNIEPEGVNLVVSHSFNKDRLIEGLKTCREKGTFIARITDETPLSYLYAITMVFSKFYLFKPFLENLNENYSYFIAEDFSGNSIDIVTLDFNQINIPSTFVEYVENYYKSLGELKRNLGELKRNLNELRGTLGESKRISDENDEYNMYKCKALMNMV